VSSLLSSRHRPFIRFVFLAAGVAGCNAILDNQPGTLRDTSTPSDETSPTEPSEPGKLPGLPTLPGDAGTTDPVVPAPTQPTQDGGSGPQCAPGQKLCHGLCVALTDPRFGCGDPACTPCTAPHGVAGCNNNACTVQSCDPNFFDCNGIATDGCEVDLSNVATCGSCNGACPPTAPVCAPGGGGFACTTGCPAEAPVLCGNQCTALSSVQHCGACDNRCPEVANAESECTAGQCAFRCRPGHHACAGACVALTDPKACGPTCAVCPEHPNTDATCVADTCGSQCKAGFADCNLDPLDGCERSLLTDPTACGACNNLCAAGQTCVNGLCQ
jgi:hypothetical protein